MKLIKSDSKGVLFLFDFKYILFFWTNHQIIFKKFQLHGCFQQDMFFDHHVSYWTDLLLRVGTLVPQIFEKPCFWEWSLHFILHEAGCSAPVT